MTGDLATAVVDGLLTGAVYGLIGAGFSLVYAVLGLFDLAHGALVMVAMLLGWGLAAGLGIDPYASLPLITLVLFAVGFGLHAGVIRPVARGRRWVALGVTAGIALAIEVLIYALLGPVPRGVRAPYAPSAVAIGPVLVGVPRLAGAAGAAMVGAVLFVFMTRTDTGRALRAVARAPVAACLVGIRPARMRSVAYGVGAASAGAAGCLLLPGEAVGVWDGPVLLLLGVAAAVAGGLGRMRGAIMGGLAVGVAECCGNALIGGGGGLVVSGAVLLAGLLAGLLLHDRPWRA